MASPVARDGGPYCPGRAEKNAGLNIMLTQDFQQTRQPSRVPRKVSTSMRKPTLVMRFIRKINGAQEEIQRFVDGFCISIFGSQFRQRRALRMLGFDALRPDILCHSSCYFRQHETRKRWEVMAQRMFFEARQQHSPSSSMLASFSGLPMLIISPRSDFPHFR